MKTIYSLAFVVIVTANAFSASVNNEFGIFKTYADFENQKISYVGKIVESTNYNIGELYVQKTDNSLHKINCKNLNYFGFKYIDGNDYILIDDIYAKVVIKGNINFLISPKASFHIDTNNHYSFTPAPNGSLSYYFVKDIGKSKSMKFERLIADDKGLMEKYKSEKSDNADLIQKQLKYLDIYNDSSKNIKYHTKKKSSKKKKGKKRK